MLENIKSGIIDTHVHIGGSDYLDGGLNRLYTVKDLESIPFPVIAKSHFLPYAQEGKNNFGSITLNNGFNPEYVYEIAREMSKKWVVWGPTLNALAHINAVSGDIAWKKLFKGVVLSNPISVLDEHRNLRSEVIETLQAIKETGTIFATGHLSSEEVMKTINEAINVGIPKIILSHVSSRHNRLSVDDQLSLIRAGEAKGTSIYSEHCAITYIDGKPGAYNLLDDFVVPIQLVGPEHCIISSDCGRVVPQDSNKPTTPFDCLEQFTSLLHENGLTINAIHQMVISNPKKLLEC